MATKLEKDLIRESTTMIGDRAIMVTITKDQTISLKLKGMKSGALEIPIGELYNQLNGDDIEAPKIVKKSRNNVSDNIPIINLHDFRSQYLIDPGFTLETKIKLEGITTRLINELKK